MATRIRYGRPLDQGRRRATRLLASLDERIQGLLKTNAEKRHSTVRTIEESILTTPLLGLAIICLLSLPAGAQYGGGTGQPNDPYLIYTAEQMNEIGANQEDWDKQFKLMADIDLGAYTGSDFKIIGAGSGNAFRGVFDGNRKRIANFTYSSTSKSNAGLFGYLKGSNVEIRNLGLIGTNVRADTYVGSLVGYADEGVFTNCYVKDGRVSGKEAIGGLIGYVKAGRITNCCVEGGRVSGDEDVGGLTGHNRARIDDCHSTCTVSGREKVGGLIGTNRGETVANSSATGKISADENDVGGLIGVNSGTVTNCSAAGAVLGNRDVGGLVGDNRGSIANSCSRGDASGEYSIGGLVGGNGGGIISDCYASGTVAGDSSVGGLAGANRWPGRITYSYSRGGVTGTRDVGGLVGLNYEGFVSTSFWDVQTSGRSDMCGRQELGIGCNNGNGRTTVEMQRASTFLDAGWDFDGESANGTEDIWSICDGLDYPELGRQFIVGDFDGDNRVDLADFAFFAERWLSAGSSFFWCRGADITGDGEVGLDDLRGFADNWLAEGIPSSRGAVYLTVDDFEFYNDLDPGNPDSNRIFDSWLDGYDNPATNGSVVGHSSPPYAERRIVHGDRQSMPYLYNTFFKFAKAELMLDPPQNWVEGGAGVLSLWFRGDSSNAVVPMSVILNGSSTVYHDNPNVTRIDTWTQWTIDLQSFTGVDLASVSSIAICFGVQSNLQPAGSGMMFFDDIRLYRSR
ncbi:MAG: GLUG motif-containing protein [Planctomycetota bacterium]